MTLLESVRLAKSYGGVRAVRDVSFAVAAGEIVALVGPNGAGKSTCFDLVSGQARPDAGQVRLLGRDITGQPPRRIARLGIGRTFQVAAGFGSMTVRENVQVALAAQAADQVAVDHRGRGWPLGFAGRAGLGEAAALLGSVGLAGAAPLACATLAYGDLKRLDLALALAGAPRLLLMDEPTAGMAPAERDGLMRLVAALARERGMGVLFTEHDMGVVFGHADRVLVLDRGRLIAAGPPDQVRADPTVRAVYLGGAG